MAYGTRDRAALIRAVLEELLVLGSGEEVAAEDSDAIDTVIDDVVADLNEREVCSIPDAGDEGPSGGAIDNAQFRHLVKIVAAHCGPKFRLPFNAGMAEYAEGKLFALARVNRNARRRLVVDAGLTARRTRWR